MRVKFRGSFAGLPVCLFDDGTLSWGDMQYPHGNGANASLLDYVKKNVK